MSDNFADQEIPNKRTGKCLVWLDQQSIKALVVWGVLVYVFIVVIITAVEYGAHLLGYDLVQDSNNVAVTKISDLLYFNFITMLTVGYGDYCPVFFGKGLSIAEAFLGVGAFTVLIAIVITKSMLPAKNTIVFSKFAYYCTEPQKFLIMFVNTSNTNIVNTQLSAYFKLGGDWGVSPSITAPFITQSVQTFHILDHDKESIIRKLRDRDCLRVGIAGDVGFTRFSTSIEYPTDKIFVIPNRDILTAYEGFRNPNLSSPELREMFHYQPKKAEDLETFVKRQKQTI